MLDNSLYNLNYSCWWYSREYGVRPCLSVCLFACLFFCICLCICCCIYCLSAYVFIFLRVLLYDIQLFIFVIIIIITQKWTILNVQTWYSEWPWDTLQIMWFWGQKVVRVRIAKKHIEDIWVSGVSYAPSVQPLVYRWYKMYWSGWLNTNAFVQKYVVWMWWVYKLRKTLEKAWKHVVFERYMKCMGLCPGDLLHCKIYERAYSGFRLIDIWTSTLVSFQSIQLLCF